MLFFILFSLTIISCSAASIPSAPDYARGLAVHRDPRGQWLEGFRLLCAQYALEPGATHFVMAVPGSAADNEWLRRELRAAQWNATLVRVRVTYAWHSEARRGCQAIGALEDAQDDALYYRTALLDERRWISGLIDCATTKDEKGDWLVDVFKVTV